MLKENSSKEKGKILLEEAKTHTFLTRKRLFSQDTSNLQKYQDLIIGKREVVNLLKHEFVMLISSWVPGVLGIFFSAKLYPLLIGSVGKGVIFGKNVALWHPHKVFLVDNVIIEDNYLIDAKENDHKGIIMGTTFSLGEIPFCFARTVIFI